jgi:hypothetical protein
MIDRLMDEAVRLFDQPSRWTDSPIEHVISGTERNNVFYISGIVSLERTVFPLLLQGKKEAAVLGVNPTGLATAFLMQRHGFHVTLIPAGNEADFVKNRFGRSAIRDFFAAHHIEFWPHTAIAIKGEQIHCQSGYCSFVCKGRFIQEGEDAERILTEQGYVLANAVVLADESRISQPLRRQGILSC